MTKPQTLGQLINGADFGKALADVLPDHASAERIIRIATSSLRNVKNLDRCTPASFFNCLLRLSQYGLEPDGRVAHLIPYANAGGFECQLILDYKGLVEVVYRTGMVKRIHADVIYANDSIEYDLGQITHHCPWWLRKDEAVGEPGRIVGAYATVQLATGETKTEVVPFDEIEAIRKSSRGGNLKPWKEHWPEMAKKTAFRRLTKWLPLDPDIRGAIYDDDDLPETVEAEKTSRAILPDLSTASPLQLAQLPTEEPAEAIEERPQAVHPEADVAAEEYAEQLAKVTAGGLLRNIAGQIREDDRLTVEARERLHAEAMDKAAIAEEG